MHPADLEDLAVLGRRRRLPRGSTLFTEGEPGDRVVLVLKGRVKVSCWTDDGREVVLAVHGPGALLGELAAIDGKPRSATANALEPMEALVVPASSFREFLATATSPPRDG